MADEHDPTPPSRPRRRRISDPPAAVDPPPDAPEAEALEAPEAAAADPTWLPMLDDRSLDPTICPFLRSVDDDDVAGPPIESPDAANRCAALRDTVPQSLRQQELVCLTSGHVNCPRYLRGAVAADVVIATPVRAVPRISTPIAASLVILVAAFTVSVGFVMANGSMELAAIDLPSPASSPSAVAAATDAPTAEPSAIASVEPSATPEPTAEPTPTPTPEPTATPTPEPTASPTPSPTPSPTASATPASDRYALLTPCPGVDDCWIYTIRAGDNLFSIANYFGHSMTTVYRLNPWAETQGIRSGMDLRLPPPTR